MVYETDFYTTRRPYRPSPSLSSYTVSSPRHYVVRDSPDIGRRSAEQVYSYSYSSANESASDRYGDRPTSRSYQSNESVTRSSSGGPGGYNYSTERSSRSRGDGPGGYSSSYSSTTSGRLPGGTSYRHYSYRSVPSRQVRILPGLGKVHVVHSYDRIVPYVGHKRLTVVTTPPKYYSTRPSILQREYDRIENKLRPWVSYSATNRYLNSDSAVRSYYISYPITYGGNYSSYYRPSLSLSYYPKYYRWHYNWPRDYRTYWPYYLSALRSYLNYSPIYRSPDYYQWPNYYNDYYWSIYRSIRPYTSARLLGSSFAALENKIDNLSRMIYLKNPIPGVDYSYDSELKSRIYRPLNLYYDYYWPLKSLNYYSDYWPKYDYLNYKYTYPSDRYFFLKGKIVYNSPSSTSLEVTQSADRFGRYQIYKPLSLYYDYYYPIRSLYWNSSFWPLYRPLSSFVNDLPSDTGVRLQSIFDDETRLIRAQTNSLLKRVHDPVPRIRRSWPASTTLRYNDALPARYANDNYIHRMLTSSQRNPTVEYTTYYTEPVRKFIGQGRLSCVRYGGEKVYNRRKNLFLYEDPLRNDIQLLSYYINKFRQDKAIQPADTSKVPLSASRPSRKFSAKKQLEESTTQELKDLRDARAARLANIYDDTKAPPPSADVDQAVKAKKQKEAARLAEEKALVEEQARSQTQSKKDEAARKAELARQEELAAQAAAERAAELEKQAELAKQAESAKQAEIEKSKKLEEERLRLEEAKRLEEEAKAEEERKQLSRLEELARQAEEEKEAELARQADELAELARQEAELNEQAKKEAELAELARQEAELAELDRQEAELAELERQEKELAELARQEAELADQAKEGAEAAKREAELAELAQQEAELAELERQQAELDALDAEAKALASEQEAPQDDAAAELAAQEAELAELERQQAELDALDAEAKALEGESQGVVEEAAEEEEDDAAEGDVTSAAEEEDVEEEEE